MQEATPETSADRLTAIRTRITAAAKLVRRPSEDIHLIAVSKTRSAEDIAPLILEGQMLFGENRVQEAAQKWSALKEQHAGIQLHLIGQLQSNKTEEAVALFDVIHSVDRLSLVIALGKAMQKLRRAVPCFIQVNIGNELQKSGISIDKVHQFVKYCTNDLKLNIVGLMCIPPADRDPDKYFINLAEIARQHNLKELSMGMSSDYECAIKNGATFVRIGTKIFNSD